MALSQQTRRIKKKPEKKQTKNLIKNFILIIHYFGHYHSLLCQDDLVFSKKF